MSAREGTITTATSARNLDQRALAAWILAGLRLPDIRVGRGSSAYLLGNMIARFSLYADEYRLSAKAVAWLEENGVDLSRTYKRSRFHGKTKPFTYEHSIPATVTLHRLLSIPTSELDGTMVEGILCGSGPVCVLLHDEDVLLNRNGLQSRMPDGWSWDDAPLARYERVGIAISELFLKVDGAVVR